MNQEELITVIPLSIRKSTSRSTQMSTDLPTQDSMRTTDIQERISTVPTSKGCFRINDVMCRNNRYYDGHYKDTEFSLEEIEKQLGEEKG